METPGRKDPRRPPSSGHRKSQSTSALAAMADDRPDRPRRHKQTSLPPVDEAPSLDSLKEAVEVLRSIRSSGRRRHRAMKQLDAALHAACKGNGSLEDIVSLQCHNAVLAVLGRHTASLLKRGVQSYIEPGDELAMHLMPEINIAAVLLQGLSLVSRSCKEATGERWAMEMFLDLTLMLRAQPALEGGKQTAFNIIDLLFCILVDSPTHARTFEELQGLEAVTRVLRGSGIAKDVRMKCCEFLYFYLLPEGAKELPDVSSDMLPPRSSSTSMLGGSGFNTPDASASFVTAQDFTPSHSRSNSEARLRDVIDLDLPFVPQTPRKPPKPSLGFQTPMAHRRETPASGKSSALEPVPPSPRDSDDDDGSLTKRDSAAWAEAQRKMEACSVGSRASSGGSTGSSTSSSTVVPRKSTIRHRPSMSASAATPSRAPATPMAAPAASAASSGSRTPASSSSSRSSRPPAMSSTRPARTTTQLSLETDPSNLMRRGSRRLSKSPLAQSTTADEAATPRVRHSRTQSAHVESGSGALQDPAPAPTPVSAAPSPRPERRSSSTTPGVQRSRGFPAELTRGRPTSAVASPSTGSQPAPLTPSRRIPSERGGSGNGSDTSDRRSVAEKKELVRPPRDKEQS